MTINSNTYKKNLTVKVILIIIKTPYNSSIILIVKVLKEGIEVVKGIE